MKSFRTVLLAAEILFAAVASTASAASLIITDVETGNGDLGNVNVPGYGSPWTTPILMTDSTGQTHVVFCDDLNHDVNVGGGQSLPYDFGLVTVNGLGAALTESVSNEMGQLANIGRTDYGVGDEDGAIAAQAAIWGIEYGLTVTSTDSTIESLITQDMTVTDNGGGWATGLISETGQQAQIIGVGLGGNQPLVNGAVPEPATWAVMLIGFGGIGAAIRSNRRKQAAAA
jgi:hypothetical protein